MEAHMRGFDAPRKLASSDGRIAARPGLEGVVRLDPPPQ